TLRGVIVGPRPGGGGYPNLRRKEVSRKAGTTRRDAPERALAAEHGEHVEDPRARGLTREGHPQRVDDLPRPDPELLGEPPHGGLDALRAPLGRVREGLR